MGLFLFGARMILEILAALSVLPATLVESHKVWPTAGSLTISNQVNTEYKFDSSVDFPGADSITQNYISPNFLKTFAVPRGLPVAIGLKVKVVYNNDPTNKWMVGSVYSYTPHVNAEYNELKVLMSACAGSGTYTSWHISQYYDDPWCTTNGVAFPAVAVSGFFKLRSTSSAAYSGVVSTGITIGADSYTWRVNTREEGYSDYVPSVNLPHPSSFGTSTTYINTTTESPKASFDPGPTAIITCPPGVEYSFDNGAWFTGARYWPSPGPVYVKARFLSSPEYSTPLSKDISIGDTDYPFAVVTDPMKEVVRSTPGKRLTKRGNFKRSSIKQVARIVDPNQLPDVVYEFSNGRVFREKKRS